MRILVIGNGAREHALSWKLKQSPLTTEIYHWPGSAILDLLYNKAEVSNQTNYNELLQFIKEKKIDLTICGPEKPLTEGLADSIREAGYKVIGPSKEAAQLEASKTFAKKIMEKAGVPTARFHQTSNVDEAWIKAKTELDLNSGVVIKVDGLASGKGVFVCRSEEDIQSALQKIKELFPSALNNLLIEELLTGREFSYFTLINKNFQTPMGCAVDFKRLNVDDQGPNTGGMGAYTPVPWLPFNPEQHINDIVIKPLLKQLEKEDLVYSGILYCGLMLTNQGVKVIEFNVRLGDPEAQVLAVNDSRDWVALFLESLEKEEGTITFEKPTTHAVGMVMSSEDYPYTVKKNPNEISYELPSQLFSNEKVPYCFGSAIKAEKNKLLVGQGRVLTVVGKSHVNFAEARDQALKKVEAINRLWPTSYWRSDIAARMIEEQRKGLFK